MAKNKVMTITAKDCVLETFRCGGKGGQKQNSTDSGARYKHIPSGAIGESREFRTQLENKKAAFRRMAETPKFKLWVNSQIFEFDTKAQEQVKIWMNPNNLEIETYTPNNL